MLFDVNKPQHCFAQRLQLQNDSLAQQIPVSAQRSHCPSPLLRFLCICVSRNIQDMYKAKINKHLFFDRILTHIKLFQIIYNSLHVCVVYIHTHT